MSDNLTTQSSKNAETEEKGRPPRRKRLNSFWEPIYNPREEKLFPDCNWDFRNSNGPTYATCAADDLWNSSKVNSQFKFIGKIFSFCDFSGKFDKRVVFQKCTFEDCDFGLSYWRAAKFTDCEFIRCSFSMSTFEASEFRDCYWENIGIAGNETKLFGTVITNPESFIKAAYTNLDPMVLNAENKKAAYQIMMLEKSKAVVAKSLLNNLSAAGDDDSYYEAIKVYLNQSVKSKIEQSKHDVRKAKKVTARVKKRSKLSLYYLEYAILNAAGFVNNWGSSIARPAVLGGIVVLAFALLYYATGIRSDAFSAFMASLDVTLLVGYTKHINKDDPVLSQAAIGANMLVGILWYAVFVPTVINRISRVR